MRPTANVQERGIVYGRLSSLCAGTYKPLAVELTCDWRKHEHSVVAKLMAIAGIFEDAYTPCISDDKDIYFSKHGLPYAPWEYAPALEQEDIPTYCTRLQDYLQTWQHGSGFNGTWCVQPQFDELDTSTVAATISIAYDPMSENGYYEPSFDVGVVLTFGEAQTDVGVWDNADKGADWYPGKDYFADVLYNAVRDFSWWWVHNRGVDCTYGHIWDLMPDQVLSTIAGDWDAEEVEGNA